MMTCLRNMIVVSPLSARVGLHDDPNIEVAVQYFRKS